MEKILLDTDIGSDIDDAECLAYLLCQPRCELLGITTVSGEPAERARIADALCQAAGRQVPIHVGAAQPLEGEQLQPLAQQKPRLCHWPHQTAFPEDAVAFLREQIHRHPGEVTLLAIGPLTNLARLFLEDPQAPGLLKGLVLMSGAFFAGQQALHPQGEWNVRCDPKAAQVVYAAAPAGRQLSVGLDVTMQVSMGQEELRRRFTSPVLRAVEDFSTLWFAQRENTNLHDPLTAVALFDPAVCGYRQGQVQLAGAVTGFLPDTQGPHRVAETVDAPRFFREYLTVTGGDAAGL